MLPGESFVRAISDTWHKKFGTIKVIFDVSMTVIAGILSFVFFYQLQGIREGTIVAAILVGFIVGIFNNLFSKIKDKLLVKNRLTLM